jgi:cytochrome c biogenesis protein CcdA
MVKVAGVYLLGGITFFSEIVLPELPLYNTRMPLRVRSRSAWATFRIIFPAP